MTQPLITEQIEQLILQQLPTLVEQSPAIQKLVLELAEHKKQTKDWFHTMIDELRHDREEQARKWEEYKLETRQYREEQARKWEEQARKWEEQASKWEEYKLETRQYREEQAQQFQAVHKKIEETSTKQERKIGAIGARWGIQSEKSFRDALAAILEQSFGVQVLNVNEFDDEGMVFGRPDQVELDVIIKNGILIICELKSSASKADMYIFERKVRFYEKRHQRQANRMIVISPMVDLRAKPIAEELGIEVYSDSDEVPVD